MIGGPTVKKEEPIVESEIETPIEEVIEPLEEPEEIVVKLKEEPEKSEDLDPKGEKDITEDVLRVVDIINSLKGDIKNHTTKISDMEKEKEDMIKKHQEEMSEIKNAIKKALYR